MYNQNQTDGFDTSTVYWENIGQRSQAVLWTGFKRNITIPETRVLVNPECRTQRETITTYVERTLWLMRMNGTHGPKLLWMHEPLTHLTREPKIATTQNGTDVPWVGYDASTLWDWHGFHLEYAGNAVTETYSTITAMADALVDMAYGETDPAMTMSHLKTMTDHHKIHWALDILNQSPDFNHIYII